MIARERLERARKKERKRESETFSKRRREGKNDEREIAQEVRVRVNEKKRES